LKLIESEIEISQETVVDNRDFGPPADYYQFTGGNQSDAGIGFIFYLTHRYPDLPGYPPQPEVGVDAGTFDGCWVDRYMEGFKGSALGEPCWQSITLRLKKKITGRIFIDGVLKHEKIILDSDVTSTNNDLNGGDSISGDGNPCQPYDTATNIPTVQPPFPIVWDESLQVSGYWIMTAADTQEGYIQQSFSYCPASCLDGPTELIVEVTMEETERNWEVGVDLITYDRTDLRHIELKAKNKTVSEKTAKLDSWSDGYGPSLTNGSWSDGERYNYRPSTEDELIEILLQKGPMDDFAPVGGFSGYSTGWAPITTRIFALPLSGENFVVTVAGTRYNDPEFNKDHITVYGRGDLMQILSIEGETDPRPIIFDGTQYISSFGLITSDYNHF